MVMTSQANQGLSIKLHDALFFVCFDRSGKPQYAAADDKWCHKPAKGFRLITHLFLFASTIRKHTMMMMLMMLHTNQRFLDKSYFSSNLSNKRKKAVRTLSWCDVAGGPRFWIISYLLSEPSSNLSGKRHTMLFGQKLHLFFSLLYLILSTKWCFLLIFPRQTAKGSQMMASQASQKKVNQTKPYQK